MNFSLIIIFWYGILHAFGPDHLTAITDFSIGKNKKTTLLITILFALGHGISLFVFAKILQTFDISEEILSYGDIISATVIIGMGLYLLFMVYADRIHLKKHYHGDQEHTSIIFGKRKGQEIMPHQHHTHSHLWIGDDHKHDDTVSESSSFTMGLLMGAGGVRGMLVTLGAVGSGNVDFTMILAFTVGVMLIFLSFGVVILYLNKHLLNNIQNVRRAFTVAGAVSLIVGANVLAG